MTTSTGRRPFGSPLPILAGLLLAALLALTPSRVAAQCDDCVFPGEEWDVVRGAELQAYGWDREGLGAVTDFCHALFNSNEFLYLH